MKITISVLTVIYCCIGIVAPEANDRWLGHWQYAECWPALDGKSQNCVSYVLKMSQKPNGSKIGYDLDIDGYQILRRISGECRIVSNAIQMVYSNEREGDTGPAFKKGEMLFELSTSGNRIVTVWKKLQPQMDTHLSADEYFQKIAVKGK